MASSSSSSPPPAESTSDAPVTLLRKDYSHSQVRVGVRVRPLTRQEVAASSSTSTGCLKISPPVIELGERRFAYDAVYDAGCSQQSIYDSIAQPLMNGFLGGYNATIMAYGQTGSGKTFTMGSEAHSELDIGVNTGLIPRFMNDLFTELAKRKQDQQPATNDDATRMVLKEYHLQASFLEVYGEDVHDLLDASRPLLPVREDATGSVVCHGLMHRSIESASQALQVLHDGTLHRTTAATLMNLTSSRSHALFTVILSQMYEECKAGGESDGGTAAPVTTTSKFTFVDLAGSERMKKTGAQGERAKEGIKINEGLLALGNVINALADQEKKPDKKIHVPYRQSKLTRLLQDALGGNSQTHFLACVSPSELNASETLSTLHYANRARNIQNNVTKNVDASSKLVSMLQAQQSFNAVLLAELIKAKFVAGNGGHSGGDVGDVDEDLMNRKDVVDYLDLLKAKAEERQGAGSGGRTLPVGQASCLSIKAPRACTTVDSAMAATSVSLVPGFTDVTPNKTVNLDHTLDHALLSEVNPDEEMAILDQLFELQHRDHEFDKEQKEDGAQLKQVEGELAEQEALLLQLRDSLKVYHNMKEKYEGLMAEVQTLEVEKSQLAEQLEKATADPTVGCSNAIKKKLEKVEKSLTRARNETRKHRDRIRKAEQEAQKCQALERKISDLKNGKVNLIRKQKEAAVRHREYTEAKTREIAALKRKGRNTEKKLTKLQEEVQMQKKNLDKRQAYCKKVTSKLKQTEQHLMELVSMRQRDFRARTSMLGPSSKRRSSVAGLPPIPSKPGDDSAPPSEEELKSMRFLLDKAVAEQVRQSELKLQYEERVSEYSDAMREMVATVKKLEESQKRAMPGASLDEVESLRELEHSVEELELKTEVIGSELENLRVQLSNGEESANGSVQDSSTSTTRLVKDKSASVLKMLLVETIDKLTESELQRKRLLGSINRKESALKSFENEVETLNSRILALTKEISRRKSLQGPDSAELIETLEAEKVAFVERLTKTEKELTEQKREVEEYHRRNKYLKTECSEAKERLTLVEKALHQSGGVNPPEDVLEETQKVWYELGTEQSLREECRKQIENCLVDTCSRVLEEAKERKVAAAAEIDELERREGAMHSALGLDPEVARDAGDITLLERLEKLRQSVLRSEPSFNSAVARRDEIARQVHHLTGAMGLDERVLASELQILLQNVRKKAEISPGSLSDDFLSQCEQRVTALRVKKAEILVKNTECQKSCLKLITEMNINKGEVQALIVNSAEQRPEWWNEKAVEAVIGAIVGPVGPTTVTEQFTSCLDIIYDSLTRISKSRRLLSTSLRSMIERAQQTLLDTVDGEVGTREACASFHEALFRLPALSQKFIHACTSEIDALVLGVDTMSQSEIEALMVVWEALNVSKGDRGKFWKSVDEYVQNTKDQSGEPFNDVLASSANGEGWVLEAVDNVKGNYKELESRILKLEYIHREVEKLRTRQDSKSRILSLDSELRLLNARLSEFEDKTCNKQRLLTKKTASSNLLKEERFRKQMQAKFASKLEQLAGLLKAWKNDEGCSFDINLLSDEVRTVLKKSDSMESWVEERTEFMHLRTVKAKVKSKRRIVRESGLTPPRKRPPPRENAVPRSDRSATVQTPRQSSSNRITRSTDRPQSARKRKAGETKSRGHNRATAPDASLETADVHSAKKRRPNDKKRVAETTERAGGFRKPIPASKQPLSPVQPSQKPPRGMTESKAEKLLSTSLAPADSEFKAATSTSTSAGSQRKSSKSKKLTLTPFGHVLGQAFGAQDNSNKENSTK